MPFRATPLLMGLAGLFAARSAGGEEFLHASRADAASTYSADSEQYYPALRSDATLSIGRQATSGVPHRAAVFPFQLPDFGPVAEPFENAAFIFELTGKQFVGGFNVDLYGLEGRASSEVLPASAASADPGDFYMGGLDGRPEDDNSPGVTKIQDGILFSGTPPGTVTTGFVGGDQLAAYLNAAYDGGDGAGHWVFLRLNSDAVPAGAHHYDVAAADAADAGIRPRIRYNFESSPPRARPFMWVTDEEKPEILDKIANHPWARSLFDQLVARTASAVASHRADRDAFIRQLPVSWDFSPARYRTTATTAGASYSEIRGASEAMFNTALDAAVLHYLTGDIEYARLAGDILHNVARTLKPVSPSSEAIRGGWIIQNDFLLESRVVGNQLPLIYDFLYDYLLENPVYDVQRDGPTRFAFFEAQAVFRQYYRLARDRGLVSHSNWSALMSTAMLNNLLALDDEGERDAAFEVYFDTGADRQDSLIQDYQLLTQHGGVWPESTQYIADVIRIRSSQLAVVDRYDPSLDALATLANFPLALPRVTELRYPNGSLIRFGDGGRRVASGEPVAVYDIVYSRAVAAGNTELAEIMGGWINAAIEAGNYNRASLSPYSSLGRNDEPLKLLWGRPEIPERPVPASRTPRSDRLPFAGITLQRNPSSLNNRDFGLMGFVGGAGFIHSHAA